jgi:hypothetical protein
MVRKLCVLALAIFVACPTFAVDESKEQKRLAACGRVFKEIMDIPDGLPKDLLNKAECVIVIPSVLKFAFGVGGDFGRGAISCRTGEHFTGRWSAPALVALEGANIGFQIGGQATDFVLLVVNPKGANSILSSKEALQLWPAGLHQHSASRLADGLNVTRAKLPFSHQNCAKEGKFRILLLAAILAMLILRLLRFMV